MRAFDAAYGWHRVRFRRRAFGAGREWCSRLSALQTFYMPKQLSQQSWLVRGRIGNMFTDVTGAAFLLDVLRQFFIP